MPVLQKIECRVHHADTNLAFPEYATEYGDGLVECFLHVPDDETSFYIDVKSEGYIASGLAVIVYMDGIYQINRNRRHLEVPEDPSKSAGVHFVLRQRETFDDDGNSFARAWYLWPVNERNRDQLEIKMEQDDVEKKRLCTIEVLVLRCGPDPVPSNPLSAFGPPPSLSSLSHKPKAGSWQFVHSMGLDGAGDWDDDNGNEGQGHKKFSNSVSSGSWKAVSPVKGTWSVERPGEETRLEETDGPSGTSKGKARDTNQTSPQFKQPTMRAEPSKSGWASRFTEGLATGLFKKREEEMVAQAIEESLKDKQDAERLANAGESSSAAPATGQSGGPSSDDWKKSFADQRVEQTAGESASKTAGHDQNKSGWSKGTWSRKTPTPGSKRTKDSTPRGDGNPMPGTWDSWGDRGKPGKSEKYHSVFKMDEFQSPESNLPGIQKPLQHVYNATTSGTNRPSHIVAKGRACRYSHKLAVPKYLDTKEKPFAKFIFHYRDGKMIEKTLGCTIPSLEAMAEFEAAMAAEERKEKEVSAKKHRDEAIRARYAGDAEQPATKHELRSLSDKIDKKFDEKFDRVLDHLKKMTTPSVGQDSPFRAKTPRTVRSAKEGTKAEGVNWASNDWGEGTYHRNAPQETTGHPPKEDTRRKGKCFAQSVSEHPEGVNWSSNEWGEGTYQRNAPQETTRHPRREDTSKKVESVAQSTSRHLEDVNWSVNDRGGGVYQASHPTSRRHASRPREPSTVRHSSKPKEMSKRAEAGNWSVNEQGEGTYQAVPPSSKRDKTQRREPSTVRRSSKHDNAWQGWESGRFSRKPTGREASKTTPKSKNAKEEWVQGSRNKVPSTSRRPTPKRGEIEKEKEEEGGAGNDWGITSSQAEHNWGGAVDSSISKEDSDDWGQGAAQDNSGWNATGTSDTWGALSNENSSMNTASNPTDNSWGNQVIEPSGRSISPHADTYNWGGDNDNMAQHNDNEWGTTSTSRTPKHDHSQTQPTWPANKSTTKKAPSASRPRSSARESPEPLDAASEAFLRGYNAAKAAAEREAAAKAAAKAAEDTAPTPTALAPTWGAPAPTVETGSGSSITVEPPGSGPRARAPAPAGVVSRIVSTDTGSPLRTQAWGWSAAAFYEARVGHARETSSELNFPASRPAPARPARGRPPNVDPAIWARTRAMFEPPGRNLVPSVEEPEEK